MHQKLEAALYKAAALTFEQLCFLFPTPLVESPEVGATAEAVVQVEFEGACGGRLVMALYGDPLLSTLAANMLGEEESPALEQQLDALKEVANIICGNVLPEIAGAQAIFRIHPPQLLVDATGDLPGEEPVAAVGIGLDEGWVALRLYMTAERGE
ncbi:MAG: chemotaxis protein CheX [Nitrospinota bacterium]|nr:MAG: chemotaxis protein CheX [Nitrospinota bacterium]